MKELGMQNTENQKGYIGNLSGLGQVNPPRCECHECTQARWRMSLESKLAQIQQVPLPTEQEQQARKEFISTTLKGPIGHYEPSIKKIVSEGQQGKGFIG